MKVMPLIISFVFVLSSAMARAECIHLPKALEHARISLTQSESVQSDTMPLLVGNLSNALEHARASERAEKNVHTSEAVVHLEAALNSARSGENKQCHMHTQAALKELELAGQCTK